MSAPDVVSRASALIPLLKDKAAWTEDNRRLSPEAVEAMADAGVFRLRVPVRYGGYESGTETVVKVAAELGRGDTAAGWSAAVWTITTWMAGLFPDEVQDEVFATPDVRVCGTLSPTAMAARTDGGIVVNGKWGFISGAWHSHWQVVVAVVMADDGPPEPVMGLVPMGDLTIIDDWHTSGLRGSGSVSTLAKDLFIPAERVLPLGALLHEQYASKQNANARIYQAPMLPVASASSVGSAIGMAKAAMDAFLERLPERGITYTAYTSQREAPLTHTQVGEAGLLIDEATFHAERLASAVDSRQTWTVPDRVQARADLGAAVGLAKKAVDLLAGASGGSSLYSAVPIQRIARDVQAVNLHALMHPDTNIELYGRVLCGQEPNTYYI